MTQQHYPPGWNEKRVLEVLAHYEDQTEDEQFAEIEAALESELDFVLSNGRRGPRS